MSGQMDELKGRIEREAGGLVGSKTLARKGRRDEWTGRAKFAFGNAKKMARKLFGKLGVGSGR